MEIFYIQFLFDYNNVIIFTIPGKLHLFWEKIISLCIYLPNPVKYFIVYLNGGNLKNKCNWKLTYFASIFENADVQLLKYEHFAHDCT